MKPHDDRALDGALRRGLADSRAANGNECPEADVLAAYYERSLDAGEMQRLDMHSADCGKCREQLAALARSEPPRHEDRVAPRSWIWDWRWLVPVVAAAAIAILWVGIRSREAGRVQEAQIVAENRPPVNAPVTEPAPGPRSAAAEQRTAVESSESTEDALEAQSAKRARPAPGRKKEAEGDQKSRDALSRRLDESQHYSSGASGTRGGNRAAAPPPPPLDRARQEAIPLRSMNITTSEPVAHPAAKSPPSHDAAADASAAASAPQVTAVQQTSEMADVQKAGNAVSASAAAAPQPAGTPPENTTASSSLEIESTPSNKKTKQTHSNAPAAAVGAAVTGGVAGGLIASAAKASARGPVLISTPDRAIMWRILPAGGIELSHDGGSTWQPQPDAIAGNWTAGSAPTPEVCWIVGRSGAIIRTSDAHIWKSIVAPTMQDLIAVTAQDANTASVAAADGTRYKTVNGGRTWKQEAAGQP